MAAISFALILAAAVQMHCDLPGGDLAQRPAASAEACAEACLAEQSCRAWSYVGGWKRCFFKRADRKAIKLRIHAAQIEQTEQGQRQSGKIFEDHDSSGKDLRRVSKVQNAESCAQHCLAEVKCESFAYLDGYGDCWLKKNQGRLFPKVFYCGFR